MNDSESCVDGGKHRSKSEDMKALLLLAVVEKNVEQNSRILILNFFKIMYSVRKHEPRHKKELIQL